MTLPSRSLVRFYNKRGTAEQWIKEGKQATHWTRLSCHRFRANEVRLQLSVLSYNLGNLWRRLGLPRRIPKSWSPDEPAAAADENGCGHAGQACPLLLPLLLAGGPSEPQAVRPDAGAAIAALPECREASADGPDKLAYAGCRGSAREGCCQKALCGRRNGAIGQHSTAGAAGKGVSNVAEVRKPLHRGGGSPTLSVP